MFISKMFKIVLISALFFSAINLGVAQSTNFNRGDVDSNGKVELTDAILTIEYSLLGVYVPTCISSGDGNDDGKVDISDTVYLLSYIFRGTAEPPAPFNSCKPDPTPDQLPCDSFESCPQLSPTVTILGKLLLKRSLDHEPYVFFDIDCTDRGSPDDDCIDALDADCDDDGLADGMVLINGKPVLTESDGSFIVTLPRAELRGDGDKNWIDVLSFSWDRRTTTNSTVIEVHESQELYPVELIVQQGNSETTEPKEKGPGFFTYEINKENGASATVTWRGSITHPVFEETAGAHSNILTSSNLSSPVAPGQGSSVTLEEPTEENNFTGRGDHESVAKVNLYLFDEQTGSLISDSEAEIDISIFTPIKNIHEYQDGEMLTLFHFDQATNLWVQRGETPIKLNEKGIEANVTVDELGWWSLGRKFETACYGIEFEVNEEWDTALRIGTEGITYSGFRDAVLVGGRIRRMIINQRSSSTGDDTAYLTARFGNTERFYLMESGDGTLELTRNKEEAIVINSRSSRLCRCNDNDEWQCEAPKTISTKSIDAASPYIYLGYRSTYNPEDESFFLEGFQLLRSGEVSGVRWFSPFGIFTDPAAQQTVFTPSKNNGGGSDVQVEGVFTSQSRSGHSYCSSRVIFNRQVRSIPAVVQES